jgi:hypothetical protein
MGDADLAACSLLVGLGPSECDDEPLPNMFDVAEVEANQLGAAKAARETDEEQSPVPHVLEAVAEAFEHQD